MHADVKARKIQGRRGPEGKAIVVAVLERGGRVKAKVIDRRKKKDLQAFVREHVEPKSVLFNDALKSYDPTGSFRYFGSPHVKTLERDFTPEQRREFSIRREIVWESETPTDAEVRAKEIEFINT